MVYTEAKSFSAVSASLSDIEERNSLLSPFFEFVRKNGYIRCLSYGVHFFFKSPACSSLNARKGICILSFAFVKIENPCGIKSGPVWS